MKFIAGFAAGVAAAWAALAIWQHRAVAWEPDETVDPLDLITMTDTGTHLSDRFPPPPVIDRDVFIKVPTV